MLDFKENLLKDPLPKGQRMLCEIGMPVSYVWSLNNHLLEFKRKRIKVGIDLHNILYLKN